ncbi:MAG: ABC transporter permease [Bacillota bacterium]
MSKILHIAYVKILKLYKEPGTLLILILLPLIFTYFMGGMGVENTSIPVTFVDNDKSEYSIKIIQAFQENHKYSITIKEEADAIKEVKALKVVAALMIPEGFGKQIRQGIAPTVQVIKSSETTELFSLRNDFRSALFYVDGNIKIADYTVSHIAQNINIEDKRAVIWERAYKNAQSKWFPSPPVSTSIEIANTNEGPQYNPLTHSAIGFSLFFAMFTIVFSIGEILSEKKEGTWQRILVFPVSRSQILAGNLLGTFAIGYFQMLVLVLLGKLIFDVNWGVNLPLILTLIAIFVLCTSCIGLFLSGILKTSAQLFAATPIIIVSTSMLGGVFWPLEIVQSKILLFLSRVTPQYWAISGLEGILNYGHGFHDVLLPFSILLAMSFAYFTAGVKLLQWEK